MDPEVMYILDTVLCGDISTPVIGQLALELMINPPEPGDPSYDTYTRVKKKNLHQGLMFVHRRVLCCPLLKYLNEISFH